MGFIEGNIEGEKVFHERVFPKALFAGTGEESNLAEMVEAERERLARMLEHHGAILFRGFSVGTPDEFSRVVQAFGWDECAYQGAAARVKMANRVYTANADPLEAFISFHHEMAMTNEFPGKIMFYCMQPPSKGGETSIIQSNVVVEKMEEELPEVIAEFANNGMLFHLHTKATYEGGRTVWQRMLNTTDQLQGERMAKIILSCDKVKFNDDGTADFTFGPMNPMHEFDGKKVMFRRIHGYESGKRDAFVTFSDGSPLPPKAARVMDKIYEDNNVDIRWEKGDILLVNNLAVQHARRPGKPPRVVLVSLFK